MIRRVIWVQGTGDFGGGSRAPRTRTRGTRAVVATGGGEGVETLSTRGLPPEGGKRRKVLWVIQRGNGKCGVKIIGRMGKPVDPARHLGCKRRRAVKGRGGWPCRTRGKANDARACMDRDTDRPGAMARCRPPGRHEKRGGAETGRSYERRAMRPRGVSRRGRRPGDGQSDRLGGP